MTDRKLRESFWLLIMLASLFIFSCSVVSIPYKVTKGTITTTYKVTKGVAKGVVETGKLC